MGQTMLCSGIVLTAKCGSFALLYAFVEEGLDCLEHTSIEDLTNCWKAHARCSQSSVGGPVVAVASDRTCRLGPEELN